MGGGRRAEFAEVEVLRADDLIVLCRIDQKIVGVPTRRLLPGTTIDLRPGSTGQLVISHELALNLGLIVPRRTASSLPEP
jgi:hypothetical protein